MRVTRGDKSGNAEATDMMVDVAMRRWWYAQSVKSSSSDVKMG